jgi:hypothetical protein
VERGLFRRRFFPHLFRAAINYEAIGSWPIFLHCIYKFMWAYSGVVNPDPPQENGMFGPPSL